MSAKKNILIIGGSSFVASNFIRLQQVNYNIKTVSRNKTGFENEVLFSDFSAISSDVFKDIDSVINCAAIVHQQKTVADEIYHKINYELAIEIANKAKAQGVKSFIQLSTIAVYGKQTHITIETPEQPINPYGKSKLKADNELLKMSENHFAVTIFRPPMIYGSTDAPGNMIRLIQFIAKGFPLPFKKLQNKRDFIHIDNLIGFINNSIEKKIEGAYLVSDNSPVFIAELYNIVVECLGKPNRAFSLPKIGFKMMKLAIPGMYDKLFGNLTIDITTTLQTFDYQPKDMLKKGILEMVIPLKTKSK